MKTYNSMPTVTYKGETYKLRSRKTEIPDLENMDSLSAFVWINKNTTAKGYSKEPNPLTGMGGAISIL
jgi:hypothetical protein